MYALFYLSPPRKINHDLQEGAYTSTLSNHRAHLNPDYSFKKKNKQKQQHKQTNKYDGLVVPCRKNFRFMREESTHRCALTEPHQTMISGHKHGFAFLILQSSQGVTGVKGQGSRVGGRGNGSPGCRRCRKRNSSLF